MYLTYRAIVALLVFVALILFQIILSKRDNKWAGLIIPIISFGLSFISILAMPYYLSLAGSVLTIILRVILVFVITNIPTAIFLAIYFIFHKNKKLNEIDKINIQDL